MTRRKGILTSIFKSTVEGEEKDATRKRMEMLDYIKIGRYVKKSKGRGTVQDQLETTVAFETYRLAETMQQ